MGELNGSKPESDESEFLSLLEETGLRLRSTQAELDRLREHRDALLLAGQELGLTTAEMARRVGMRREQAHYAITRARADALERALQEVS